MAYDVIIVGAGPSGAAAAYCLGEAGWQVLVRALPNTLLGLGRRLPIQHKVS